MSRTRLSPEAQRALVSRQAALTALTSHPSWPEMEDEVERKIARLEKLVLARALGSGLPEIEQAQLRGMIAALRWIVAVPRSAENTLERFLKAQGVRTEGE